MHGFLALLVYNLGILCRYLIVLNINLFIIYRQHILLVHYGHVCVMSVLSI